MGVGGKERESEKANGIKFVVFIFHSKNSHKE